MDKKETSSTTFDSNIKNVPSCKLTSNDHIEWTDFTDGTPDLGEDSDPVFSNEREKIAYYIRKGRKLYINKDGCVSTDKIDKDGNEARICISKGKFATESYL